MSDENRDPYKRNNKGQFEKGTAGGPGRPPAIKELQVAIHELTPTILAKLTEVILNGEPRDITMASTLLLAYGYGKPSESMALDISSKQHIQHEYVEAPKEVTQEQWESYWTAKMASLDEQ